MVTFWESKQVLATCPPRHRRPLPGSSIIPSSWWSWLAPCRDLAAVEQVVKKADIDSLSLTCYVYWWSVDLKKQRRIVWLLSYHKQIVEQIGNNQESNKRCCFVCVSAQLSWLVIARTIYHDSMSTCLPTLVFHHTTTTQFPTHHHHRKTADYIILNIIINLLIISCSLLYLSTNCCILGSRQWLPAALPCL